MSTAAHIGYGSKFEMWDGAAFVAIAEVTNIDAPNAKVNLLDASNMDSDSSNKEFVPGMTDPGQMKVEFNYVPSNTSDLLIQSTRAALAAVQCRITYPNAVTWTFNAIVMDYQVTAPVDGIMKATLGLQVTGSIAVA